MATHIFSKAQQQLHQATLAVAMSRYMICELERALATAKANDRPALSAKLECHQRELRCALATQAAHQEAVDRRSKERIN